MSLVSRSYKDISMKKFTSKLTIIIAFTTILSSCNNEVKYGSISVCKNCNEEIAKNIYTKDVTMFDKKDWRVVTNYTYCEKCGNEKVSYTVTSKCKNCGKIYDTESFTTLRKAEKKDMVRVNGYCSSVCRFKNKIDKGIQNAVDDVIDYSKGNK